MARRHKQVRRNRPHSFAETPSARIQRSKFDRSHGLKTTFDAGWLIPVFVDEVLPGDTHSLAMTAFARLATPIHPVMDNMYLESFFFFVPNRLVWGKFQRFMGEEPSPGDSTDFLVPRLADGKTVATGDLHDYMGLPLGLQTASVRVNALPFRCYLHIWDEWFRDQNLQNRTFTAPGGDGPDSGSGYILRRRGKRHDYFTSALPWPQKGDAVQVPLGSTADILSDTASGTDAYAVRNVGGDYHFMEADDDATGRVREGQATTAVNRLYADLSTATAATINQLRQAFQVQKLLERNARGGTRYTEIIRSHFGVTSPDQRLQRPEYLGGGRTMVNMGSIPQTSQTEATGSEQGNLAGIGTATAHGHGFVKSFVEHGYIIGLVSVRADLNYQQGLNRMWSRETRFDFYWPALARIGEQAVLSKEIFVGNEAADDEVFGYQERYAEYRYKPSQVTGLFRSDAAGSLDVWHLAQDFSTRPVLNAAFIEENPPIERVIAVTDEPHFIMDCFFSLRSARPMPVFGVPGLIDHF